MNAEDLPVRRLGALMGVFYAVMAVLVFPPTGRAEMPTAPTDGITEGSAFFAYSFVSSGRTLQNLYLDSELLGLKPGDVITGISFRNNDSVSGFAGAAFARFDIAMGRGNDTLGTTFADNFASPPTLVRSGALTIDATDFDDGESPNAFGKPLALSTPYEYTGGNLVVEIRGSIGTLNLDAFGATDGIQSTAVSETDADATTGSAVSIILAIAFEVTPGGKTPTEIAIPNGALVEGSDTRNIAKLSAVNGQVWQNLYKETDLGGVMIPGDKIVGYCLRLNGAESHFGSAIFSRFDVKLGRAASPFQNLTGAFADNFSGPPTVARTGPMTLQLPKSPSPPNAFGGFVRFTNPHTFAGGDLVVETRTLGVTDDIQIDYFRSDGNTGGTLVGNELSVDATTITSPEFDGVNWALQLKTCPDAKKPDVRFRGKPRKKPGKRPTRVNGVASDEGAVKMIIFRASTGDKKRVTVNRARAPFVFKFRNRKMKSRVRVRIIAIDLRGNRKIGMRVYR